MKKIDTLAEMMDRLDKMVIVYKDEFGTEDIEAINYIKRIALEGYWVEKRIDLFIQSMAEDYGVNLSKNDVFERVIQLMNKILLNKSITC